MPQIVPKQALKLSNVEKFDHNILLPVQDHEISSEDDNSDYEPSIKQDESRKMKFESLLIVQQDNLQYVEGEFRSEEG